MKDFAVILSISMKGFVWRWMVALCVFPEIVAAQKKVLEANERNVALNGTCSASSGSVETPNADCTWLFDNNTGTCFATHHDNCTNTNNSHISFNLKHSYIIHKMVVYPQRPCCHERLHDLQVIFDGEVVDRLQKKNADSVLVIIAKTGRPETKNVTLYRRITQNWQCSEMAYPSITLCEVKIYTCREGKWGPSCDKPCDAGCVECRDNASDCLECKKGYWGPNTCANNCGQGCESGNCNVADGTCQCRESQQQHWAPPKCESCIEKYWGDKCEKTCPQNCQGPCNKTDGQCEGCKEKYWGDKCEKTCPQNCQGPCNKTDGQCEVTPPPSEKKFPMWAAALIALGILGLIALLVCLLCLACRKRRKDQGPAQDPEGGSQENPEGEKSSQEEQSSEDSENKKSSQEEQSAEDSEKSQQPGEAAEGGEAAPAE